MSIADPPRKSMTAEELMEMPDDGIDRWIIRGELIERPGEAMCDEIGGPPMTMRNRAHTGVEFRLSAFFFMWLSKRPEPRGNFHSGEIGFRLRRDPETFVGVDLAYAPPELIAGTDPAFPYYDGPPALAVEILSPSDRFGDVWKKVRLYLEVGSVVWLIDPDFRTVGVHRPGRPAETFNETQELSGDPELPGFRVRVADLFS